MIRGLDVSNWQSEKFPLELPDGTPVDFVIIQVTRGVDGLNEKWPAQAAWARENGLAVGFYHFGKAGDGRAQADYFHRTLGSLYPGETLWYDWENSGTPATAPSNDQKDIFIKTLKALRPKKKVGLYCNVDFWKNRDQTDYYGDGLWIASWRRDANSQIPTPAITAPWVIHQYADGPGVDHDRAGFPDREAMKVWGGKPEDPTVAAMRGVLEAAQLLTQAVAQQTDVLRIQQDTLTRIENAVGLVKAPTAEAIIDKLASRLNAS